MATRLISFRGVRTKNLKNIDLDLPAGKIIVICGPAGSGKSALVIDTIYAECYLRYIESMSPYVRQFLEMVKQPELDYAENLPPALAFRQKNRLANSRSIVASASGLSDYLRLLYVNIADFYCLQCGKQLDKFRSEQMAVAISAEKRRPVLICFRYQGELSFLTARGFYYCYENGKKKLIEQARERQEMEVIGFESGERELSVERVLEAIETVATIFAPPAIVVYSGGQRRVFSWNYFCENCRLEFQRPAESLFSFNSPLGACELCSGYGQVQHFADEMIFDFQKTIVTGAIKPLESRKMSRMKSYLFSRWSEAGIDLKKSLQELQPEQIALLMNGNNQVDGLREILTEYQRKGYKPANRFFVKRFLKYETCPQCNGKRFNRRALSFKIRGMSIADFLQLNVAKALGFIKEIDQRNYRENISEQVFQELELRLQYLVDAHLSYLTLDRLTHTLSRGEWQRLNLTFILGSSLSEMILALEQPTADLHLREVEVVKNYLLRLKKNGNTVLVTDNHPEILKIADLIIQLGPGGGKDGGKIVWMGKKSLFNRWKKRNGGSRLLSEPQVTGNMLYLGTFYRRNLKGFELSIPDQGVVLIIGPSGAGKSTLLQEIASRLKVTIKSERVEFVDFAGQAGTGRSTLGTYFDLLQPLQKFFSSLPRSRTEKLLPGAFSRYSPQGQCPQCQGRGKSFVEMQFFSPLEVECTHCQGSGLRPEVLDVRHNGLNITDLYRMSIEEVFQLYSEKLDFSKSGMELLRESGLGYLQLDQEIKTLSSGEFQLIKLIRAIRELPRKDIFLFDEPVFSWNENDFHAVEKLFTKIVNARKLLLCVDQHPKLVLMAEYLVELGPEGGENGGWLLFAGNKANWLKGDSLSRKKFSSYLTNR